MEQNVGGGNVKFWIYGKDLKKTIHLEPWMNRFTLEHLSVPRF